MYLNQHSYFQVSDANLSKTLSSYLKKIYYYKRDAGSTYVYFHIPHKRRIEEAIPYLHVYAKQQ